MPYLVFAAFDVLLLLYYVIDHLNKLAGVPDGQEKELEIEVVGEIILVGLLSESMQFHSEFVESREVWIIIMLFVCFLSIFMDLRLLVVPTDEEGISSSKGVFGERES